MPVPMEGAVRLFPKVDSDVPAADEASASPIRIASRVPFGEDRPRHFEDHGPPKGKVQFPRKYTLGLRDLDLALETPRVSTASQAARSARLADCLGHP